MLENIKLNRIIFDDEYSTRYEVQYRYKNENYQMVIDKQKNFNEFSIQLFYKLEDDWKVQKVNQQANEIKDRITIIKGLF